MATNQNPKLNARLFRGPHVLNFVTRIGGVASAIGKRDVLPAAALGRLPQPVCNARTTT